MPIATYQNSVLRYTDQNETIKWGVTQGQTLVKGPVVVYNYKEQTHEPVSALGYSDFHNMMGFASKKMLHTVIFLKMFV